MKSSYKKSIHIDIKKFTLYLLVGNLLLLDVFVIKNLIGDETSVLGTTTSGSCPQACVNLINAGGSKTGAKEFIVTLGSGSNITDEWTDVTGVQSYIDSSQYGKIKKVTFEATVHVPTGNQKIYVRLYNVSDSHPVWFSEMWMEGTGPRLLTSEPITLGTGNKLYQVQMKSQLKFKTDLVTSRIRITTY